MRQTMAPISRQAGSTAPCVTKTRKWQLHMCTAAALPPCSSASGATMASQQAHTPRNSTAAAPFAAAREPRSPCDAPRPPQVVPPERLLVFEAKQGWRPLCEFLGVPTPDQPFPHLHEASEFEEIVAGVRKGMAVLAFAVPAAAAAALLVSLLVAARRRQ